MSRRVLYIFVFLLSVGSLAFSRAEEFDQDSSDPHHLYGNLKVRVYTERTVFQENEPVNIKITVMDEQKEKKLTIFPDKEYFNYYLEVYSQDGVSLPEKDEYFASRFNAIQEAKKGINQSGLFREIPLAPNQVIGKVIDLTKLYNLPVGRYLVRMKFYPKTVLFDPVSYIYSPFIQVFIEPSTEKMQQILKTEEAWDKDRKNLRSPEDSVMAFFNGKKEENWDKFFYVIELSRLITVFKDFSTAYIRGTSNQKDAVLRDFKTFLQNMNKGEDIRSVEITESITRGDQSIVKVMVHLSLNRRPLSREYIFKLEKENHWVITAYTVVVR